MTELEKYHWIYSSADYSFYGHTNHGKNAYDLVACFSPVSIVDIGCGHNEFCHHWRQLGIPCVGVDFACPSADVIASAMDLPFKDGEFDLLTSFDTLEHLLPSEIDRALTEFKRISRRFIFSISYRISTILVNGENLHPSVFPETWWIDKLAGYSTVITHHNYLIGKWFI